MQHPSCSRLYSAAFHTHEGAHDTGSAVTAFASGEVKRQAIASKGLDDKAFTLGWRLGMLDIRAAIDHLIVRIKAEAQRHQSTRRNESMSLLETQAHWYLLY